MSFSKIGFPFRSQFGNGAYKFVKLFCQWWPFILINLTRATHSGGVRNQGLRIFFIYDSWGPFTQNKFGGKNLIVRGPGEGSPKWDGQKFVSNLSSEKLSDCTWMINIYIFLQNKIQLICKVFVAKINWSVICVFPFQHSQISRDFDVFSNLLDKLETYFWSIFLYYVQHEKIYSFQFFPGGHI